MRKIVAALLAIGSVVLLATGCGSPFRRTAPTPAPAASGGVDRLQVTATVYPLAWFAKQIGGDRADVTTLVPAGQDPHAWEPTPGVIRALRDSDLFIYNGAGLEPWAERLLTSADAPQLHAVAASAALGVADEHADPHVWLDPVLAQQQVTAIAAAMAAADPAGRDTYDANAARLRGELAALDQQWQTLAACPQRTIVMTGQYFTHPAERYGLTVVTAGAGGHEAEPRPGALAKLVSEMRASGIRYVLAESAHDRTAATISEETGAAVLVLHPLERLTEAERAEGHDYMTLMQMNAANLRKALGCEAEGM